MRLSITYWFIKLTVLFGLVFFLSACSVPMPLAGTDLPAPDLTQSFITATRAPTASPTQIAVIEPGATTAFTAAPTKTPSAISTSKVTLTPTPTLTPTETSEPGPTLTPTFAFPQGTILMQANCRYGPGTAYLYSHGLYEGDRAFIHGRNASGTWLWIKPENLERHCWAAATVLQVNGDVFSVRSNTHVLPRTTFAGPPTGVQANRNGNEVTLTWDSNNLSVDKFRGFLIEATLCQNGNLVWTAVQTDNTSYRFTDEEGCSAVSSVLLFTAEKHGYSEPVNVLWP